MVESVLMRAERPKNNLQGLFANLSEEQTS